MNFCAISFGGMNRALFFVVVCLPMLLLTEGCVSGETPKMKDDISSLKTQLWDLQTRAADLELKVSQNENDILFLAERVKAVEPSPSAGLNQKRYKLTSHVKANNGAREKISKFGDLTPEEIYKLSMMRFNQGDHDRAADGFSYIARRFPGREISGRAQFWLGEILYGQKQYARATGEYKRVIMRYPKNQKVADAMVKIGFCELNLGKYEDGKKTLGELIVKYPKSAAAIAAREKLKEINTGALAESGVN